MTERNPERTPYATTILPDFYKLMHELTKDYSYLHMTEKQFVGKGMRLAGGKMNPATLSNEYRLLMADAGLPPMEDGKDGK